MSSGRVAILTIRSAPPQRVQTRRSTGAAIERCDWPNVLAVRVRRGQGLRSKWARAHREASGAVSMRDTTAAEDCAALRASVPAQ